MQFDPAQEVPGYRAEVERESSRRNLAFIGWESPLCGLPARQLTARQLLLLIECGNAFVCGRPVGPGDVGVFLWFVSPSYSLDRTEREKFMEQVAPLPMAECVLEIQDYLERVFMDSTDGGGGGGRSYFAPVTGLIVMLARAFGWDDEAILEKPLARLFQYQRYLLRQVAPGLPLFNPSDALIGRWLAARQGGTAERPAHV